MDISLIVPLVLAAVVVIGLLIAGAIERAEQHRERDGAQPQPTARQLRRWKRERLQLAAEGRVNRRIR